jgi:DNA polymerase-3 subunit gamma/tau
MTQALYRKWRPQTFDEVVGQDHVVRTLRNGLVTDRTHHAYLFTGPRGTGKTTTARLLAKAVNCRVDDLTERPCNACPMCQAINEGRLMDLIEIDAASNTGVDDVRELRERVGYRPNEARYKVYVVDEVHMLSNAAFNALLKTLEEPPPHAIFVLATTEPQKIPATVLSRCQRFDFRRIPLSSIIARLRFLSDQESIQADEEALTLIARQSTGSMRDAESLLDQLAAYAEGGITIAVVRSALGTGNEEAVFSIADALLNGDVHAGLAVINQAVEQGADPRQFARQVVDHLRALLLTRLGSEVTLLHVPDGQRPAFEEQAARFSPRRLTRAIRLFNQAALEARVTWQPQLPLELALVEAAQSEEKSGTSANEQSAPKASPSFPPPSRSEAPSKTASSPPPTGSRQTAPAEKPPEEESPVKETPPPNRAATGESLNLQGVQGHWPELRRLIRQRNLPLEALLNSGEPVKVEQNTLTIGFPHQFHKGKVEEEGNRRLVEDTLRQLVGYPVRVRCTLVAQDTVRPSPAPQQPPQPAEEDRLVQRAVTQLGARVVNNPGQQSDG